MLPIDALKAVRIGNHPAPIDSIGLSPALRLLVLAPHPDDFDAIAITLRYLQVRGNDIHLAVLSGGSKGVQDSYANPPTWEQKARLREQEQLDSCAFFGLSPARVNFLRLPEAADGELAHDASNASLVLKLISETSPDVLFLPCGNDSNAGHRRTYDIARAAVRDLGKPLLALYNKDVKTLSFQTDLYVGFDEILADWKRTLLRFHDTQQARNIRLRNHGFDDRILSFNRDVAHALGLEVPYAEAFRFELFHADRL
ncbi:MAG TPA: PIG-L family deacetylase [Gammaproteobacteria bacterium]|nr:PIG-L family deacetylase [Gammaproteobacteria bacterium]